MNIAATASVWLASYWIAHGRLRLDRAERIPGSRSRVMFFFKDPDSVVENLNRQYEQDLLAERLIRARRAMTAIIDVTFAQGRCEPDDVAADLAHIDAPLRGERVQTQ